MVRLLSTKLIKQMTILGLGLSLASVGHTQATISKVSLLDVPPVYMSGEILFQLLASDFATSRGEILAATLTTLDVATKTDDPRVAQRALDLAIHSGNLIQALKAADFMLELDPDHPQAQRVEYELANVVRQSPHIGDLLREHIQQSPDRMAAIQAVQRVVQFISDPTDMVEQTRIALTDVQGHPEANVVMAYVYGYAKQYAEGITFADQALSQRVNWEPAAEVKLHLGLELNPDEAIASAKAYARQYPDYAKKLQITLVKALIRQNRIQEALSELSTLHEQDPSNITAAYLLGAVYIKTNQIDSAEVILQQAYQQLLALEDTTSSAQLNADALAILSLQADLFQRKQQYDDAFNVLSMVPTGKNKLDAMLKQAHLLQAKGSTDEALSFLSNIHVQDQHYEAKVLQARASILIRSGRVKEGIAVYEELLKKHPDNVAVMYDLGLLYAEQDDIQGAERWLREVIRLRPEYAPAYNGLGYTFVDKNIRLDEAQSLIEKALSLTPNEPAIIDSLGWLYFKQGRINEALSYLEQAHQGDKHLEIALHYIEALWVAQQYDQAKTVLDTYLSANLSDEDQATISHFMVRLGIPL